MKPGRLWPIITGMAALLSGVGLMEWYARSHETRYEVIEVRGGSNAESSMASVRDSGWLSTEPVSPEHTNARRMLQRGEVEEALAIYRALTDSEDTTLGMLNEYAHALRQSGDCEEAFNILGRALSVTPDDPAATLSMAQTFECVGELEQAGMYYERAVELRPGSNPPRLLYGEFLRSQNEHERAVDVLRPASRSGGNDSRAIALAAYGDSLLQLGHRQEAIAALGEAIQRSPSTLAIWISVARSYVRSGAPGDLVLALEHAERAARLAPEAAAPHAVLGEIYQAQGEQFEALDAWRRATELEPHNVENRVRLVKLALEEEELSLASRSVQILLGLDEDNPEFHYLEGQVHLLGGRVDEARAAFDQGIALSGGALVDAWIALGDLERQEGNGEAALEAFQAAVNQAPELTTAWSGLGVSYLDLGRLEEARDSLIRALELDSSSPQNWSRLGRIRTDMEDLDGAVEAYEASLHLDPTNRNRRLRLAIAYRRADRAADSIVIYQALVRDEPRYVSAWYNLGIAYSADGALEEAKAAYEQALQLDPDHRNSLKNLGLLELRLGNRARALTLLTDALDRDPSDTMIRLRIASTALETGDPARCLREARLLLSEAPDDPELRELVVRCGGQAP